MAFDPPHAFTSPPVVRSKLTGSMYDPTAKRWVTLFECWEDAVSLEDVIAAGERGAQPGG